MPTCPFCGDPSCIARGDCGARRAPADAGSPFELPVFLPSDSTPPDPDVVEAFDHGGTPPPEDQDPLPERGDDPPPGSSARRGILGLFRRRRARIGAAILVGAAITSSLILLPNRDDPSTSPSYYGTPPAHRSTAPSASPTDTPPHPIAPSRSPDHPAAPQPSASKSKSADPKPPGSGKAPPKHTPEPEPTTPYAYQYVGVKSGLCLDDPFSSTEDGTQLQLWPCYGTANQRFVHTAATELRLLDDMCVTATGGRGEWGTPVVVARCDGGVRQRWQLKKDGTIRQDGLCVDATGGFDDPGTPIEMWECVVASNEQWSRERPPH
ncbi:RICIN domain-containing protein [Streptomyces sp. NEAU-Y11]|uniref:RICIN domain-containing protein n=1 Tax=Streptomyces cucumeris TaxID=2962890 RepID=UPI0020C8A433|nr:ricin-type beta-trefoil lectin domain protein [Streptomyces sp. NEAU-Y11]MCP9211553.1 ricin-type beta-trefoil lectin domain protein [Streptomyces sp. NEAU-Y11]